MNSDTHRSPGIDLLRGICVLLVVLHHINLRFIINKVEVDAVIPAVASRVVFWSGYFSVIAFFVISGFLITTLSLRRWGSPDHIDIRHFYRLRFARIAPCLLLLVALLAALHLLQVNGFVIDPERASLGRTVLAALTFHINVLEGHHGYLPGTWDVLWSLSVEEVFYLAFPIVCLVYRRERWLILPLLALIVIGPINRTALEGQRPWDDYAYLSCADGIAFGCLAALLAARLRPNRSMLRSMMTIGIACVSLIVVFRSATSHLGLHKVGLGVTVLEMGVALILVAMAHGTGSALLVRGTGLIRSAGRSSYEIYLTHMLVILSLTPLIVSSKPGIPMLRVWYIALLLLSVTLGWIVRRSYSDPANKALRSQRAASEQEEAC